MARSQYVNLQFKPGLFKNGTVYQAQGRWYDADLMRWSNGAIGPVGGWRTWGYLTTAVTGVPRTAIPWQDNSANRWMGVGTPSKLYVYDDAASLYDITPTGFTAGRSDADPNNGYGDWKYGRSTYGYARPDLGVPLPATIWSFAMWGEDLTGCTPVDGKLYEWDTSGGTQTPQTNIATQVPNSPEYIIATLITPERIQMCFGGVTNGGVEADANPRKIFWSDSGNNETWGVLATNLAGDHIIVSDGELLGGINVRGQVLIFTTTSAHTANYVGLPYVYQFNDVGDDCGPVSMNAVVVAKNVAYWLGRSGNNFFMYDGYVRPMPCDVQEHVDSTLQDSQASKTVGWHNSLFNEVVWFYQSTSGTEVDSYVSYNYLENHWSIGSVGRTATSSRGIFAFPILFDSSGNPYEHEIGGTYEDVDTTTYTPYVESGPIQIGAGNQVLTATSLIPDVSALGDITSTFYTRMYPSDSDTAHGPYTMASPTSVRFTGRTVRMRCTSDSANNWNVGIPRLELQPNGRR
jgi:hypothetical protein